jgi:hypothetical protein
MVCTKFDPPAPYSHAVRTTVAPAGCTARAAHSPASLVRP